MKSDHELLRAWRAGDKRAGNELLHRHFDAVLRFFRNKVDGNCEDLVQRTFVACVEARDRFRHDSSFRTYLFGCAHNILRDHYRKQRRVSGHLDFDTLSVMDLGAGPLSVAIERREKRLLLEALRRIPLASQVILELFYWERMSGSELGVLMGVKENTARSRLRRARELLTAQLDVLAASPEELRSTVSDLERWAVEVRAEIDRKMAKETV